MELRAAYYGFGENVLLRRDAADAMAYALKALITLDTRLADHPLVDAWIRIEHEVAGAAAARESGAIAADFAVILSARLGARMLPRGHIALGDLDARARSWAKVRARHGDPALRALVAGLSPRRGTLDFASLGAAIATALGQVSAPALSWREGEAGPVVTVAPARGPDLADLVLAVPFALRRLGITRHVLPAAAGRVRLLAGRAPEDDHDPAPSSDPSVALKQLARWARSLGVHVDESAARLRLLERYAAEVRVTLADVRRPMALQRLVAVGLSTWALWPAKLAKVTGVEVSSAWRTMCQAADLGLVMEVPGQQRSRGDGVLYAVPPWLRLAGLSPAPRGRPSAPSRGGFVVDEGAGAMAAAMADADAALAEIDALLARSTPDPSGL